MGLYWKTKNSKEAIFQSSFVNYSQAWRKHANYLLFLKMQIKGIRLDVAPYVHNIYKTTAFTFVFLA